MWRTLYTMTIPWTQPTILNKISESSYAFSDVVSAAVVIRSLAAEHSCYKIVENGGGTHKLKGLCPPVPTKKDQGTRKRIPCVSKARRRSDRGASRSELSFSNYPSREVDLHDHL